MGATLVSKRQESKDSSTFEDSAENSASIVENRGHLPVVPYLKS